MVADYELLVGDCLAVMADIPDESWNCCITSPPYYNLRNYDSGEAEIGQEPTLQEYIETMVKVCAEVKRILKPDGTLWLNLGDGFNGSGGDGSWLNRMPDEKKRKRRTDDASFKPKDLMMMPARVAIALQADGWWLRNEIIWAKLNCMPSSVTDRCVCSTERIYLLAKSRQYHFDHEAIRERSEVARPGNPLMRNKRDCWRVATASFDGGHFAVFPPALIEPCVLAGCPEGGVIGDPFAGSGTTGIVAVHHGRNFVGIELNAEYAVMAEERIKNASDFMAEAERQTTLDWWAEQ